MSRQRKLRLGQGTVVAQAWNLSDDVVLYDLESGETQDVDLPFGMTLEECIAAEGGWSEFASFEIGPGAYTYLRRSLVRGAFLLPQVAVDQMVFPELRSRPWAVVQMNYHRPLAESGHRGRPSERDIAVMEPIPVAEMEAILNAPAVRPPAPDGPAAPPTEPQLRAYLEASALEDAAADIVASARPQWFAIGASGAASFLLDASDVPGFPAPVAAIDLYDVDASFGFPSQGSLLFSYDVAAQQWGHEPSDAGSFSVTLSESSASEVVAASAQPSVAVGFVAGIGLPAIDSLAGESLPLDGDEEEEAYLELLADLYGEPGTPDGVPGTWLLGHPYQLQDDMLEQCAEMAQAAYGLESEPSEWRLLLQLASESEANMNWGDGGFLYYWIREQDLAERRFDRVWCILQTM